MFATFLRKLLSSGSADELSRSQTMSYVEILVHHQNQREVLRHLAELGVIHLIMPPEDGQLTHAQHIENRKAINVCLSIDSRLRKLQENLSRIRLDWFPTLCPHLTNSNSIEDGVRILRTKQDLIYHINEWLAAVEQEESRHLSFLKATGDNLNEHLEYLLTLELAMDLKRSMALSSPHVESSSLHRQQFVQGRDRRFSSVSDFIHIHRPTASATPTFSSSDIFSPTQCTSTSDTSTHYDHRWRHSPDDLAQNLSTLLDSNDFRLSLESTMANLTGASEQESEAISSQHPTSSFHGDHPPRDRAPSSRSFQPSLSTTRLIPRSAMTFTHHLGAGVAGLFGVLDTPLKTRLMTLANRLARGNVVMYFRDIPRSTLKDKVTDDGLLSQVRHALRGPLLPDSTQQPHQDHDFISNSSNELTNEQILSYIVQLIHANDSSGGPSSRPLSATPIGRGSSIASNTEILVNTLGINSLGKSNLSVFCITIPSSQKLLLKLLRICQSLGARLFQIPSFHVDDQDGVDSQRSDALSSTRQQIYGSLDEDTISPPDGTPRPSLLLQLHTSTYSEICRLFVTQISSFRALLSLYHEICCLDAKPQHQTSPQSAQEVSRLFNISSCIAMVVEELSILTGLQMLVPLPRPTSIIEGDPGTLNILSRISNSSPSFPSDISMLKGFVPAHLLPLLHEQLQLLPDRGLFHHSINEIDSEVGHQDHLHDQLAPMIHRVYTFPLTPDDIRFYNESQWLARQHQTSRRSLNSSWSFRNYPPFQWCVPGDSFDGFISPRRSYEEDDALGLEQYSTPSHHDSFDQLHPPIHHQAGHTEPGVSPAQDEFGYDSLTELTPHPSSSLSTGSITSLFRTRSSASRTDQLSPNSLIRQTLSAAYPHLGQFTKEEIYALPSPPTRFKPTPLGISMQQVVNTYAVPQYKEANPALYAIPTFPFLFGVMFGDIFHGLCLALVGLVLLLVYPRYFPSSHLDHISSSQHDEPSFSDSTRLSALLPKQGIFSPRAYRVGSVDDKLNRTHLLAVPPSAHSVDSGADDEFELDNDHSILLDTLSRAVNSSDRVSTANRTVDSISDDSPPHASRGQRLALGASSHHIIPSLSPPPATPPPTTTLSTPIHPLPSAILFPTRYPALLKDSLYGLTASHSQSLMVYGVIITILMMAFFSFYVGWIYNDAGGIPAILTSSYYHSQSYRSTGVFNSTEYTPYPFGVDPGVYHTNLELPFLNSLKMKFAIILGVLHMSLGIGISAANHVYHRKYHLLWLQFAPRFILLMSTFGYMTFLIIYKWCIDYPYLATLKDGWEPPSIIQTMINMFINPFAPIPKSMLFYTGQQVVQVILLMTAIICVVLSFCGEPIYTYYRHRLYFYYRHRESMDRDSPSASSRFLLCDHLQRSRSNQYNQQPSQVISSGTMQDQKGISIPTVLIDRTHRAPDLSLASINTDVLTDDAVISDASDSDIDHEHSSFLLLYPSQDHEIQPMMDRPKGGDPLNVSQGLSHSTSTTLHNQIRHVSTRQENEVNQEEELSPFSQHYSLSTHIVHHSIHTIEFVLGVVSNTASYLRLWALSLAHAQLAQVFWNKVFLGIGMYLVPFSSHKSNGDPYSGFFDLIVGNIVPIMLLMVAVIVWFGATVVVLLMMDLLEVVLHTVRLIWVEFQSKFYHGGGYLFSPLKIDYGSPISSKSL